MVKMLKNTLISLLIACFFTQSMGINYLPQTLSRNALQSAVIPKKVSVPFYYTLRPTASKITYAINNIQTAMPEFVDETEDALIKALTSAGRTRLSRNKIKKYLVRIKNIKGSNFEHKIFFKKILALVNSSKPLIEEFAVKSFIAVAESAVWKRKGSQNISKIYGISGEVSGVYELANRRNAYLKNIRIGKIKAINATVKERDTQIIIKEFDALSENAVFEFKFHLSLKKLYEQVVGLGGKRISHFKILLLPEFSYIRNLVYFGENDGGHVIKAALDFVQKDSLFDCITIGSTGSISIKFKIKEFESFIFDKATLKHACAEEVSPRYVRKKIHRRIRWGFLSNKQAKNARKHLFKKIAQIPKGEHFDVIIGVSNPSAKDMIFAKKILDERAKNAGIDTAVSAKIETLATTKQLTKAVKINSEILSAA